MHIYIPKIAFCCVYVCVYIYIYTIFAFCFFDGENKKKHENIGPKEARNSDG